MTFYGSPHYLFLIPEMAVVFTQRIFYYFLHELSSSAHETDVESCSFVTTVDFLIHLSSANDHVFTSWSLLKTLFNAVPVHTIRVRNRRGHGVMHTWLTRAANAHTQLIPTTRATEHDAKSESQIHKPSTSYICRARRRSRNAACTPPAH